MPAGAGTSPGPGARSAYGDTRREFTDLVKPAGVDLPAYRVIREALNTGDRSRWSARSAW